MIFISINCAFLIKRKPIQLIANQATELIQETNEDLTTQSNLLLQAPNDFVFSPKQDYSLYLFRNDSLLKWYGNTTIGVYLAYQNKANSGIIQLNGGHYLFKKIKQKQLTVLSLILIKSNYSIQNNYVKNEFVNWLQIPNDLNFVFEFNTQNNVKFDNKIVFSLKGPNHYHCSLTFINWITILYLLSFILILFQLLYNINRSYKMLNVLLFFIVLAAFKLINYLDILPFIKQSSFCDVKIYSDANNIFNYYLFDVLTNAFSLLLLSVLFRFIVNRLSLIFKSIFLLSLLSLNVIELNYLLKSLITNSTLSFDFLNIFSLKIEVLIALLSITLIGISNIYLINLTSKLILNNNTKQTFVFVLIVAITPLIIMLVAPTSNWHQTIWIILLFVISISLHLLKYQNTIISNGILLIVLGLITSGYINLYLNNGKNKELELISYQLSERQDLNLPIEFSLIESKLIKDEKLNNLIKVLPSSDIAVQQYIKQNFFGGYFNRYDVELSMFDKDCTPLLSVSQGILTNEGFFEDQINYQSDSTQAENLYFIEKYKKNARYIARLLIDDYKLYILLEPKQFEDLGSFPDLFLDQSQQRNNKQKQINFAIYRNKQNTNRLGDFNYPFVQPDSITLTKNNPNYTHYFFYPEDLTCVVISEKKKGWAYFFTYNSYTFIFISIISFGLYVLFNLIFNKQFIQPSLTRRIQSIIILVVLLALGAVGITSTKLVISQFENENIKQLQEKATTINNELQNIYKPEELFTDVQKELVNIKLKEYAHLFNTDVTLYNASGNMFNTSQPRLYELGLASNLINFEANQTLQKNQNSGICVNEKAGTLNYLSYYTSIYNANKQIIGFLNLPYFSKQNELESELSGIISTLINVYVILFVISILSGIILAGYITRPLRIIQQQIAKLALGKSNEQIIWESNDELGKLVTEYNSMLLKLEESANLLAQSEREDAWREMAKQVAHEIKNPLTPMKLNLQYLQHLLNGNEPDFKERFTKASTSIIEQIDALANIATEFSNFAKLPSTQLQKINLIEILNSSLLLFQHENVIKLNINLNSIIVNGDKDQALRVFNNIFKNAKQALIETKNPEIVVNLINETENTITIEIFNNGPQIELEVSKKLFTPNFTTKTTGSGLGLAMVNSSMQSFGGKVWFQNQPNGVSFYLLFTKA